MAEIYYKEDSFIIIGICMEVHRFLGRGFKEAIYKEALEMEFNSKNISFEREKIFRIPYKGKILKRKYIADFVVAGEILLEIKSTSMIINSFFDQTRNYLRASGLKLGIIVNFGKKSLEFQRVVL